MLRERFSRPLDPGAVALSDSTEEDAALLGFDLWGSLVHAGMLGACGIIPRTSARRIRAGLKRIAREAARGRFPLRRGLEDVHLNVESVLTARIGSDGARLHTARSRNDQVALDLALFEREALLAAEQRVLAVVEALLSAARGPDGFRTVDGWTHLQPAQRLYWAGILGAHALRFERDAERLARVRAALSHSPLGSGAIAGSSLPIDRRRTARALGFAAPSLSSLDSVTDRDAALDTIYALTLTLLHASQLAEELVIGSMPSVGRVRLSDRFVTTSSLMPHKRNPDLAELVRAESAGALGRLTAHLALVRSLPIGYQRDLQAGKPVLIDSVTRALRTLEVLAPMISTASYRSPPEPPNGSTATVELVDELVRAGTPFRTAHRRVARWLSEAEAAGRAPASFRPRELERAFPELAGRRFRFPSAAEEPERRRSLGGSARAEVERLLTHVDRQRRLARRANERTYRRLRTLRRQAGVPESLFRFG